MILASFNALRALNILAAVYAIFVTLLHIWLWVSGKKIATRDYKIILLIMGFFLAILASQIEPPQAWDLYRHFEVLERMRNSGIDSVYRYSHLFIINYFFYFVALSGIDGLLVLIPAIINIFIFTYITCDLKEEYHKNQYLMLLTNFFMFFALVHVTRSVSGIRNVLAFSIGSLAVYLDIYKQKKGILKFSLYVIPIFIHLSSIIFIVIRFLNLSPKIRKFTPFLMFWEVLLNPIALLLIIMPIGTIQRIGRTLMLYNERTVGINNRVASVNMVLIIIVILSVYFWLKKDNEALFLENRLYISFVLMYLFTTLGGLSTGTIFERLLHGLAYLLLPIFSLLLQLNKSVKSYIFLVIVFIFCLLMYYNQILHFINALL